MRVVLLTGPFRSHDAFISTIAARVPVAAAVRETRFRPKTSLASRAAGRVRAAGASPSRIVEEAGRWLSARARDRALQPTGEAPAVEEHEVTDLNAPEGIAYVRSLNADVIAVCGTGLLKPDVFESASAGAINLHLGLSPRYRGSHCVFWPLYNREPEWVGVTVHYVDPGIDAGPILAQRRPAIDASDDLESLVAKSLRLGFETSAELVERLMRDRPAGVAQQLTEGRNYNAREATEAKQRELKARLSAGWLRTWVHQHGGTVPPVPLINV